jgi:hypothetical protein
MGRSILSSSCRKQTIVATSSCTAELIQLSLACKEAMWLRKLFKELFEEEHPPLAIAEDNRGAKLIADNKDRFSDKTKHLAIHHFFCQEQVANKLIEVRSVSTHDQLADIFTKPLSAQKFIPLRERMGVVRC